MVVLFRLLYLCAALFAISSGGLVIASPFVQDRVPQAVGMLGIHLVVGSVFLGLGVLLLGLRRHVARIAALAHGGDGATTRELAAHLKGLLAYLVAGGVFLCAVLGIMTYGILSRIDQDLRYSAEPQCAMQAVPLWQWHWSRAFPASGTEAWRLLTWKDRFVRK